MSLRALDEQLKISYRTGRDDMVKDFFVPCLEQSRLYRRCCGYFTSHGLALAARGVAKLVTSGGKMRLVASPHLEADDVEALNGALNQRADLLRAIATRSLPEIEDLQVRDRLTPATDTRTDCDLAISVPLASHRPVFQ